MVLEQNIFMKIKEAVNRSNTNRSTIFVVALVIFALSVLALIGATIFNVLENNIPLIITLAVSFAISLVTINGIALGGKTSSDKALKLLSIEPYNTLPESVLHDIAKGRFSGHYFDQENLRVIKYSEQNDSIIFDINNLDVKDREFITI